MFQLSCRAKSRGRGLVPVTAVAGSPDPATAGLDRWTIFIHGFNNSWKTAHATWSATSEDLQRYTVDLTTVVLFYWPGDYSRWEVLSAMNYPKTVPIAEETARLLAEYLQRAAQDRRVPLQLSFVAHSLGSLVVLETVKLLRVARANIAVHDVLLMAAAVPEGFCVAGEAYGELAGPEANEVALYSLDDRVLKRYFQVGQEIADRLPDNRRRAVGRTGGPGAGRGQRWSAAVHLNGFGHGDYWKKRESLEKIGSIVTGGRGRTLVGPCEGQRQDVRDSIYQDALPSDVLSEDDCIPPEVTVRWLARAVEF